MCNPGKWSNSTGVSECESCARGRYQSKSGITAEASCLLCKAGSFASLLGTSECGVCAAGSWVAGKGSTECEKCATGKFGVMPGAISESVCLNCSAGTFVNTSGASQCDACAAGTFIGQAASTECELCQAGYSSANGSVNCFACPIGSSAPRRGTPQCSLCQPGTVSSGKGRTACTECGVGKHYSELGGAECSSCLPGTFTSKQRSAECVPCNVGSFVNTSGATKCKACAAGLAAPLPAQDVCKPFATYFGKVTGTWDVAYDDGSFSVIIVDEDGTVTMTTAGEDPILGQLQPSTGNESLSGWDYRLVDQGASVGEYLFKLANGTLSVDRSKGVQTSKGMGSRRTGLAEDQASFPLLLVVIGSSAFLVLLVSAVLCACKRRSASQKAIPSLSPIHPGCQKPNGSCRFDEPSCEVVARPKLLGADRYGGDHKGRGFASAIGKEESKRDEQDSSLAAELADKKALDQTEKESEKKSALLCPAGHALLDCRVPCRAQCDGCSCVLEKGQHAMDCRPCDFVLCDSCRWLRVLGSAGEACTMQRQANCDAKPDCAEPSLRDTQPGAGATQRVADIDGDSVSDEANSPVEVERPIDLEAGDVSESNSASARAELATTALAESKDNWFHLSI